MEWRARKLRSLDLPELDPIVLGICNPTEATDTVHLLDRLVHVGALGAQLNEHRIEVSHAKVQHRLPVSRSEIVGLGFKRRKHGRTRLLVQETVLVGPHSKAIAV